MHKRIRCSLVMIMMIAQPALAADTIDGSWINPRATVIITMGDCHEKLCGWVSWAGREAIADAANAGVPHLVGTELLQEYHANGIGHWAGRVYVPDMGRTFSSSIERLDSNRLKISGCLVGGWFCKSQIWLRH